MLNFILSLLITLCLATVVCSQASPAPDPAGAPLHPPAFEPAATSEWSLELTATSYFIPEDENYTSPLLMADRGCLHLEARHNYEALNTASLWLGYNFSWGEKVTFDFTPMLGGVFGHTKGLAPGFRMGLGLNDFEFTTEAEYVFDAKNSEDNFFYIWSELSWSITESFWVGLVGQRTRLFQSELDIQRGLLVGFTFKKIDFTAYLFNAGWTDPTFVFSIGSKF